MLSDLLHKGFREKKWCYSFAVSSYRMKWHQRSVLQMPEFCISDSLFSDFAATIFSIFWSTNHSHTKLFYNDKQEKIRKRTFYSEKYGVCLNSLNHRKLMNLTARIDGRSCVKNRAVLVSFHNQHIFLIVFV